MLMKELPGECASEAPHYDAEGQVCGRGGLLLPAPISNTATRKVSTSSRVLLLAQPRLVSRLNHGAHVWSFLEERGFVYELYATKVAAAAFAKANLEGRTALPSRAARAALGASGAGVVGGGGDPHRGAGGSSAAAGVHSRAENSQYSTYLLGRGCRQPPKNSSAVRGALGCLPLLLRISACWRTTIRGRLGGDGPNWRSILYHRARAAAITKRSS